MLDILSYIGRISRPALLSRAAQAGAKDYRRTRHLPRILGATSLPKHADALLRLSEIESEHNDRRRSGDATYSAARHISVLIAIAGEAALLRDSLPDTLPRPTLVVSR